MQVSVNSVQYICLCSGAQAPPMCMCMNGSLPVYITQKLKTSVFEDFENTCLFQGHLCVCVWWYICVLFAVPCHRSPLSRKFLPRVCACKCVCVCVYLCACDSVFRYPSSMWLLYLANFSYAFAHVCMHVYVCAYFGIPRHHCFAISLVSATRFCVFLCMRENQSPKGKRWSSVPLPCSGIL